MIRFWLKHVSERPSSEFPVPWLSKKKNVPPLVIILDSVDQLRDDHGVFNMLWLPRTLAPNIYFIVSMLSDRYHCLENTKRRIMDESKFLTLHPLCMESAIDVVNHSLAKNNHRINPEQRKYAMQFIEKCREPRIRRNFSILKYVK